MLTGDSMSAGGTPVVRYDGGRKGGGGAGPAAEGVDVAAATVPLVLPGVPATATAAALTVGSKRARLGPSYPVLGVLPRRDGVLIETS